MGLPFDLQDGSVDSTLGIEWTAIAKTEIKTQCVQVRDGDADHIPRCEHLH